MIVSFFDAETSNLSADYGQLLCASIAEFNPANPKKPWCNLRTFTLKDYKGRRWVDRELAMQWRDALEDYDIVVSWNGLKFDLPFLETRLRRWKCRPAHIKRHKDLLYTSRFKLRLSSNKLASVAEHLKIAERYGVAKTSLDPERWTQAMGGHLPSYKYIVKHCELDVKVLACIWHEIKHLVSEIK